MSALVVDAWVGDGVTGARRHEKEVVTAEHVEVVLDARASDRDAEFTAFAHAAREHLGRTAWLLTGDVHQASELVQMALVRTYEAWPRARATDPLAYARRVLANARIDTWRRRRREVLRDPAEMPTVYVPGHEAATVQRDELVRALALLPSRQRKVVVLRYLVGLSEREVADDLGVTVGTVKTQASRGLRRLRAALVGEDTETGKDGEQREG